MILFRVFSALILSLVSSAAFAQAVQEHPLNYLAISSDTNIRTMPRIDVLSRQSINSGIVMSPVTRMGTHLSVEAEMILRNADYQALLADSRNFGQYRQMGMPNLVDSRVVIPGNLEFITYTHMSTRVMGITQNSKHYVQVQLTPGRNTQGGEGQTWVLYSPTDAERRSYHLNTQDNESAFWDFEGAWYMQPLADGSIYCRYYIAGTMKNRLVGTIFGRGPAMSQFASGVFQIMQRLATRAQERAR